MHYLRLLYGFLFGFSVLTMGIIFCPAQFFSVQEILHAIAKDPIPIPEADQTQRVATLNGNGYIFYILSPLAKEFLNKEARPGNALLEIGSGFSNVPIEALKLGAAYTANDISFDHLKILVARSQKITSDQFFSYMHKLILLHASAPYELPIVENIYDAILLDKSFHFMEPSQIEYFMQWAQKALKFNGKLYILTMTPFIAALKDFLVPHYLNNRALNNIYAGHVDNINAYKQLPHEKNKPAKPITFFCSDELKMLFAKFGFSVEQLYYLKVPTIDCEDWSLVEEHDSDLVAIVGRNEKRTLTF